MKIVKHLLESNHPDFEVYHQEYCLGEKAEKGQEVTPISGLLKQAKKGDATAQYNLGLKYEQGIDVPRNYQKAIKWYQRAADQEFVAAQSRLGVIYQNEPIVKGLVVKLGSLIVKVDYQDALKEAFKWNWKAAEQGNVNSQYNLGWMYGNAKGVTRNYQEAIKWHQKAADQGFVGAQYTLGWMYEEGLGVGRNYQEAIKWYQRAADQGFADAQAKVDELNKLLGK
ncbi:MAG: hypothetical protein BGO68_02880 [Candidatus Amoebophilus sp. 36-38]|nr:MAG: hypothetical protein BGO68_02880 [Candidatus Amoebophilus sp. 36-38]